MEMFLTEEEQKEIFQVRCDNDPLFRRLVIETQKVRDENMYILNTTLIELALLGRLQIIQSPFGELLFSNLSPD
jgi:hypothetical protein